MDDTRRILFKRFRNDLTFTCSFFLSVYKCTCSVFRDYMTLDKSVWNEFGEMGATWGGFDIIWYHFWWIWIWFISMIWPEELCSFVFFVSLSFLHNLSAKYYTNSACSTFYRWNSLVTIFKLLLFFVYA